MTSFAFGLASGISSLKRTHFALSITGTILVIFSGIVVIFGMTVRGYTTARSDGLTAGIPIISQAILSLIFVAVSKKEFS